MFWRQPKVFISYRRADSAIHALALRNKLAEAFGKTQVFRDVDSIGYGDRFAEEIDREVSACDVMIAVIGPHWQTLTGTDGVPRILAKRDYVRREIATALRSAKRLIPVLVGGAVKMPDAATLPPDLAALA